MSARVRNLFRTARVASFKVDAPDGEIVRHFADTHDEAAFAELVRRHGPMVMATCRRVLCPDAHAAEDAFQATFLVLATRAEAVSPPERIGAFLYGVAVHVAKKAKAWARKVTSTSPLDLDGIPAKLYEPDPDAADLRAKIDDVLAGLPPKYRAAVVLCELEQLSRKEAAAALGWSEGTLSSRLARARKLLADRLTRRGVVVPAVMLGTGLGVLLPASAALASVPAHLAASTVRTATLVAAGATSGAIPAPVVALAQGIPTMHTTTSKLFAAALACCALALGALGLYALTAADPPTPAPPDKPSNAEAVPTIPAEKTWVTKHTFERDFPIMTVAFGPDLVAAGTGLSEVVLWNVKTGKEREALSNFVVEGPPTQPAGIDRVSFSPNGTQLLVITGGGKSIHQVTVAKKDRKSDAFGGGEDWDWKALGITPDGAYWLHASSGQEVKVTLVLSPNQSGGKFINRLGAVRFDHPNPIEYAAAADENTVATVSTGTLRRWRKGKDEPLWEVKLADVANIVVTSVSVSPGGKLIAVTGAAGQVWLFDATTGKLVTKTEKLPGAVRSAAFSPDGKRIVAGCADKTARVYDTETGKELAVLKGHTERVNAVAFSTDGAMIVTGSEDKTVRVWEYRRVESVDPDKKPTVRGLSLNPADVYFPDDQPPKPIEIRSADELAKAPVFHNDAARAAVGKQVDFSKEKLVMLLWKGSRTDRFGLTEPSADGTIVYYYEAGASTGPARFHYWVYAVPKHVTFVFKDKSEELEIRALAVKDEEFVFPKTGAPKPVEIKSADELAKSPVFRDDDSRAAVGKLVDFSKEKMVVFLWTGSATDKLNQELLGKDGTVAFTFRAGTGEDERQPRARAFTVPKGVTVEFKDKSEDR